MCPNKSGLGNNYQLLAFDRIMTELCWLLFCCILQILNHSFTHVDFPFIIPSHIKDLYDNTKQFKSAFKSVLHSNSFYSLVEYLNELILYWKFLCNDTQITSCTFSVLILYHTVLFTYICINVYTIILKMMSS
jgi:hypothetical protein